jgi:hypothetical protein
MLEPFAWTPDGINARPGCRSAAGHHNYHDAGSCRCQPILVSHR